MELEDVKESPLERNDVEFVPADMETLSLGVLGREVGMFRPYL